MFNVDLGVGVEKSFGLGIESVHGMKDAGRCKHVYIPTS